MPTDSIREQILKKVAAALATITTANGYANTVETVERLKQGGQTFRTQVGLYLGEGDEEAEEGPLAGAVSLVTKRLTVGVLLVIRQNEATDARPADEALNSLQADVEKVMAVNARWDELALDTREVGSLRIDPEEGVPEVNRLVTFEVSYRHRRTDPASLT